MMGKKRAHEFDGTCFRRRTTWLLVAEPDEKAAFNLPLQLCHEEVTYMLRYASFTPGSILTNPFGSYEVQVRGENQYLQPIGGEHARQ